MNKLLTAAAALVALAFLPFSGAHAACHFATAAPIVCTTPNAAAMVYRQYGNDVARIQKPYTQDLLHEAQCRTYKGAHDIKVMSMSRVAFPDGYEAVANVSIDDRDLYTVHAKYLAGVCDAFRPTVEVAACDDGPGKAACEQRRAEMLDKARASGQRIEGDTGH